MRFRLPLRSQPCLPTSTGFSPTSPVSQVDVVPEHDRAADPLELLGAGLDLLRLGRDVLLAHERERVRPDLARVGLVLDLQIGRRRPPSPGTRRTASLPSRSIVITVAPALSGVLAEAPPAPRADDASALPARRAPRRARSSSCLRQLIPFRGRLRGHLSETCRRTPSAFAAAAYPQWRARRRRARSARRLEPPAQARVARAGGARLIERRRVALSSGASAASSASEASRSPASASRSASAS